MGKKITLMGLTLIAFMLLPGLPFLQSQDSEHLTITTYYPSPVGSYNEMTVASRQAIGDVNGDGQYNTADMAVDGSGNPINGTLTVKDRLGIGTRVPKAKLEIAGRVYQSGVGQSTFFGFEAGMNDDLSANQNIAFGYQALRANTGGSHNIAIGAYALLSNTIGDRNIAISTGALQVNSAGYDNIAVGPSALANNALGSNNIAIGPGALLLNTIGNNNMAIGASALSRNTAGNQNIAICTNALYNNTIGNDNVAVGPGALYSNTAGYTNMAFGNQALVANTIGDENTAIGASALYTNTTGNRNTAVGFFAGAYQADGTTLTAAINSLYLGAGARGFNNNDNNSIVIGADAVGIGANSVVLGNDSIATTALKGNVGIGTTTPAYKLSVAGTIWANGAIITAGSTTWSDILLKKDIKPLHNCLDKIKRLRGVYYSWKEGEFTKNFPKGKQIGLIAQELEKEFPELVTSDNNGYKGIAYDKLTVVLLEAIKSQQQEIEALKKKVDNLKGNN